MLVLLMVVQLGTIVECTDEMRETMTEEEASLSFIRTKLAERRELESARCRSWGGGYTDLHRRILSKPHEQQKLLVAVPHLSGEAISSCLLDLFLCCACYFYHM